MIGNNWIALVITFVLALAWLRLNDFFAAKGWISGQLSRKIIHAGTGPIFVLCWLLFDNAPYVRYLAALVPFAVTVQFFLVGIGVMKDQAAVDAMTRHGDRREILLGPFFYGVVFVLLTILYWKTSPIGITALMILCGGDGFADIIGKRVKSARLPWSKNKSVAGSIAMFVGGFVFSAVILGIFSSMGIFTKSFAALLPGLVWINLASTVVEFLPINDVDNLTVPAIAVLLGHILF